MYKGVHYDFYILFFLFSYYIFIFLFTMAARLPKYLTPCRSWTAANPDACTFKDTCQFKHGDRDGVQTQQHNRPENSAAVGAVNKTPTNWVPFPENWAKMRSKTYENDWKLKGSPSNAMIIVEKDMYTNKERALVARCSFLDGQYFIQKWPLSSEKNAEILAARREEEQMVKSYDNANLQVVPSASSSETVFEKLQQQIDALERGQKNLQEGQLNLTVGVAHVASSVHNTFEGDQRKNFARELSDQNSFASTMAQIQASVAETQLRIAQDAEARKDMIATSSANTDSFLALIASLGISSD